MTDLRIVHLSDFHFDGSSELRDGLARLIDRALARQPDVVVVTGDLSADGRPEELQAVAVELARFGDTPTLVIPGNRDVEASTGVPGEATRVPIESDLDFFLALEPALSFGFSEEAGGRRDRPSDRAFSESFGQLEPVVRDGRMVIVGLNSSPRLRPESLERAARRLRQAPAGALRIVALHHGLLPVPGRKLRDGDVTNRAGDVLELLIDLRVDLVLHGHIHRANAWQLSNGHHALVVASAGALVNDGRLDASFLEVVAGDDRLTIERRSATTGTGLRLYDGPRSTVGAGR